VPVKTPRRAIAVSVTALIATAAALFAGGSAAQAYPGPVMVQMGGVVFDLSSPPVANFVQSTPEAAVTGGLDVGLGETLNIVQSDPGWLMVLNNTSGSPLQWNGTINVDANLLVISPAGINLNGTITGGGDVVLSTGTTGLIAVGLFVQLAPLATDGTITVGATGSILAGGLAGFAGNDITISGSVHADGNAVSIVSDDQIEYQRYSGDTLAADGSGFAGGLIQTTATANVTAAGVVHVQASAPSTSLLDGNLASDGQGTVLGSGVPGVVSVIGTSSSNDGQFDALANIDGPVGGQLGAHMFGGASTPFVSGAPFQLLSYGPVVPNVSVALAPFVTLFDDLDIGFGIQCSTLEEPENPESAVVPTYAELFVFGLEYGGVPIAASGEVLPNQAPIVVPGFGTVALNEQVKTVVDGWEILTSTAAHIVTPTDDIRLGVVECAQLAPATAQLAATGADRADAQLGFAGAALLALAGVVLVLSRRRRAQSVT
jgi:hypothetical protein